MIQGGDPRATAPEEKARGAEPSPTRSIRTPFSISRAIGAAFSRWPTPGPTPTAASSSSIHQDYALPPSYVIFGKVTRGIEVVERRPTRRQRWGRTSEMSRPSLLRYCEAWLFPPVGRGRPRSAAESAIPPGIAERKESLRLWLDTLGFLIHVSRVRNPAMCPRGSPPRHSSPRPGSRPEAGLSTPPTRSIPEGRRSALFTGFWERPRSVPQRGSLPARTAIADSKFPARRLRSRPKKSQSILPQE